MITHDPAPAHEDLRLPDDPPPPPSSEDEEQSIASLPRWIFNFFIHSFMVVNFCYAGSWDSEECLCSYMPGLCREPGDEGRDGDGVKDRSDAWSPAI